MAAPNMATITASLERSLQNCSLNHHSSSNSSAEASSGLGIGITGIARSSSSTSSTPDDRPQNHHLPNTDTPLELNSHISLPYHWEQCLDLKVSFLFSLFSFQKTKKQFFFFLKINPNPFWFKVVVFFFLFQLHSNKCKSIADLAPFITLFKCLRKGSFYSSMASCN